MTTPINPFQLPGWTRGAMRPLCPWMYPDHRDYYVSVDGSEEAYQQFTQEMDLDELLNHGKLVLVAGESGCGKTALVNRCADWVVRSLNARNGTPVRVEVLDMTDALPEGPQRSIEDRIAKICDRMFDKLVDKELLQSRMTAQLAPDRSEPDRIFPRLSTALQPNAILVVLLPTPGELTDEVVRFAKSLRSAKVLFLTESAFFTEDDVAQIFLRTEPAVLPIALQVGKLDNGDAQRFVKDRMDRQSRLGSYPRMDENAIRLVADVTKSVAMLQRFLHETYDNKRARGLNYTERELVTEDDIRAFINNRSRKGLGKP